MLAFWLYIAFGLLLARLLLPDDRPAIRWWMGLVFAVVLLCWLPCLFAFFLDFTAAAQYAALAVAAGGSIFLLAVPFVRKERLFSAADKSEQGKRDRIGAYFAFLLTAFCAYLLHTHVLKPGTDGGLWVGQSTYGDLAMHVGFIESLFRQGKFPPEYSIFPGQQLNYPFLVDAASAGLRFFGLSLRAAVILPSLLMFFLVFWGFWLLADKLTGRLAPSLMAWLLFVFNGGFGFYLFLGKYPFSAIFTGYYTTPTNYMAEDIRWVNVICDMLIPQRTTMAGWCVLLAAIFLLIRAVEQTLQGKGLRTVLLLAVLAASMPMIHTHSFLALGILSAAWFFTALPTAIREQKAALLVRHYVFYGLICLALAAPQIVHWTMDSVSSGKLLSVNLGWVCGAKGQINSWFLFYAVNCGVVFLAMWPAIFFLKGQRRRVMIGALAIFVLSNLVAFQPNLYDNNKLLYIWFILTDILVCDWLYTLLSRIKRRRFAAALAAIFLFFGSISGLLSVARESISTYRLLSKEQVDAADFIVKHTEPDSTFLTASNHTNAVSVLTGRNIVCGPGLYLYFHGVGYQQREAQAKRMFEGGDEFLRGVVQYGVDYVYISDFERNSAQVNEDWFAERYTRIYDQGGIRIYRVE